MLNKIILIGRLVRDPEIRYTTNGTPVTNFTLAVERSYTNQQGERDVDFIFWTGLKMEIITEIVIPIVTITIIQA